MKNWKTLKTKIAFESKYFHLRIDECETFSGKIMPRYYVVDFPDWVQVVAYDKVGRLVLVRQYRYPGQGWFYELPGGSTDANRKEDPLLAAKRELQEETGYTSDDWVFVGTHFPNPALMNNRCHVYLAKNCEQSHGQSLDPFEEIQVELVEPEKSIEKMLHEGKTHSLMLASIWLSQNKLQSTK